MFRYNFKQLNNVFRIILKGQINQVRKECLRIQKERRRVKNEKNNIQVEC
ncbi:unnamed protein product [Paramecium sonneborni]|uniref:Uncharacterized protein n=1 Tax=Paramecium sonneborni TaxID=65129 RepID=A0A8S1PI64_9CILI|nr:unnamed protein product [Paramecium sonneborni]